MAISGKVYGKNEFSVGIKAKAATAFEDAAAVGTTYQLLPVVSVSPPALNLIESGEIRSNNAGMIETDGEQFRSRKGGWVTMDFEVPAERDMIVRLLANVLQDHTESTASSITTHTISATSAAPLARPALSSEASVLAAGIPSLFDIGLFGPAASEDYLITSAVLQNLSMNFDMTDGRCMLSGTFYSGFASSTGFKIGQNITGNSAAPALMHTIPLPIESYFNTKQLDVNGSATDMTVVGVSFSFANNCSRVGRDSNGDAEAYAWGIPSVDITGELSVMYDGNFKNAANNVLQDFLDGDTATLTLQQGDGTVNALGEMNIVAEIYSTAVNQDYSGDTGAVITIPFKVVQPTTTGGVHSGTAFSFQYADNKAASAW